MKINLHNIHKLFKKDMNGLEYRIRSIHQRFDWTKESQSYNAHSSKLLL